MPYDYDDEVRKAWIVNRKEVLNELKKGNLDLKIGNYSERHGFDRKGVVEELNRSEMFRAYFAKDPNKQSIHEKKAAEWIAVMDGIEDFRALPNKSFLISNGKVWATKDLKAAGGYSSAKSPDFRWKSGKKIFYAAHKHTKEEGGAQANQYKDLQKFITEARGGTEPDLYFVAIADGPFYQGIDGQAGKTRLDTLKSQAAEDNSNRIHACTIADLEFLVSKLKEQ